MHVYNCESVNYGGIYMNNGMAVYTSDWKEDENKMKSKTKQKRCDCLKG